MPVTRTYVCDQCNGEIKWGYRTVEYHTIKESSATLDFYQTPQEQAIFCSMECLGKSLQWWANKYDKENP